MTRNSAAFRARLLARVKKTHALLLGAFLCFAMAAAALLPILIAPHAYAGETGLKVGIYISDSPSSYEKAGDRISYTVWVENIGDGIISDVVVYDTFHFPEGGSFSPLDPDPEGATHWLGYGGWYTVTQEDVDNGEIIHEVTVIGKGPSGEDFSQTASATISIKKATIEFVNDDNTVLQSESLPYGATPEYKGDEPTKASDGKYEYTFAGWDPEIVAVNGDATYTATYEAKPIVKKATLTFDLAGGTLDGKTGTITVEAYVGDKINLPAAPTKEGYTFKCWKGSEYAAGAEYEVEGDHDFTADWEKASSDTLPKAGDPLLDALYAMLAIAGASALFLVSSALVQRRRNRA